MHLIKSLRLRYRALNPIFLVQTGSTSLVPSIGVYKISELLKHNLYSLITDVVLWVPMLQLCLSYKVLCYILGDPEVSANLYCNSRTSVLWKLRDDMRLLMGHLVGHASVNFCRVFYFYTPYQSKGLIIFIFLMITEIK